MPGEWTRWDTKITISLAVGIVLLSFLTASFGLTSSTEATDSDIPEFNITTNKFDLVGDLPRQPNGPDSGELLWEENSTTRISSDNEEWLDGSSTQNGTQIFVVNNGNASDPKLKVEVQVYDNGNLQKSDSVNLTFVNQREVISTGAWEVVANFESERDAGDPDKYKAYIGYTIENQRNSGDWFDRTIGSALETGSNIAGMVGWIGAVVLWAISFIVEFILNFLFAILDFLINTVQLMHWMLSTFSAILSGAQDWAKVLLTLPTILLSIQLGKLIILAISLLPTT